MCDMTHLYPYRGSFVCATWCVCMCDKTHLYVRHDLFIRGAWLIHMYDMTHSYVWHESFICVTWLNTFHQLWSSWVWCGVRDSYAEFMRHSHVEFVAHCCIEFVTYSCVNCIYQRVASHMDELCHTHTHNFMSHTHTIWNPHCPPPSVSIGLTNRSFSFIYGVRDSFISEVRDSHIPLNPHCRPHQHPPDWQIDDILIRMWGSWLIHIWSSWPTHTSKSKLPPPSASIKLTYRWYTHSCVGAVTHSYIKFVTHTYLEIHTAAPVSIH